MTVERPSSNNMKKTKMSETPSAESVKGIVEIFEGVTTTPAKKKSSKYPEIDGERAAELADQIILLEAKFKAVEGPFKSKKKELIEIAFPQFFEKNQGLMDAPSSMLAHGESGGVRVTFKGKYTAGDKAKIYELLTPELAKLWFRQWWSIKIDGDMIPTGIAAKVVAELKAVMAKYGTERAMEIKAMILPVPAFTEKRHVAFTPPLNLKINEIVPQQAAVSTHGVK
jgi:hypothetical protein